MQQPLLLNACKKAVHFLILLQLLCHSAMPHCSLGIHSAPTSPWKLIYKVVAREVTMGTGNVYHYQGRILWQACMWSRCVIPQLV